MEAKLTAHQQGVFDEVTNEIIKNLFLVTRSENIEDRILSLTGPAGTGKSFLTAKIVDEIKIVLEKKSYCSDEEIYVTAPTHKAVKVIKDMLYSHGVSAECRTIHSFLKIKPIYDYATGAERFVVDRFNQKQASASLLIIDESSMISNQIYSFIVEVVSKGYVNTVLFIGDPYQLMPINQGSNNDVYNLKKQFKLTEIVRQAKDSKIIQLASKIRNKITSKDYDNLKEIFAEIEENNEIQIFKDKEQFIKDFYKNPNWYLDDKIITTYSNSDVNSFNDIVRKEFWKEKGNKNPQYFLATDKVRFKKPLNSVKFSIRNTQVMYQNGDEVIINTAELIYDEQYKLEYWKCVSLGKEEHEFFKVIDPNSSVKFNNILEQYTELAKNMKYPNNVYWWRTYFQLRDAFADVQYIYSSTIYKLQGSTFETIYIDLASLINNKQISNDLLFRLVYVAITRAKKCVKILY
jgi:ATP-dependent exoDNAse (exonuclease V) alpha subunit